MFAQAPQLYDFVKSVKAGEVVQATERALISGDPWFHISDGWISGKYVEGWVKITITIIAGGM